MELSKEKATGCTLLTIKGKIDAVTSPVVEKELLGLIETGEKVFILNLSGLEYISSAGLRSILSAAKQLKAKEGKLIFSGVQGPVKDVFKISGFGSIFKICNSNEEALKDLI